MLEFPRVNAYNTLEPVQNSLSAWMHTWSYNVFLETLPRRRPPRLGSASQIHSDFVPTPHCSLCWARGCRDATVSKTWSLPPELFGDFGFRSDRFGGNAALCKRHTVRRRNVVTRYVARNQGSLIKCDVAKSPPSIAWPQSTVHSLGQLTLDMGVGRGGAWAWLGSGMWPFYEWNE